MFTTGGTALVNAGKLVSVGGVRLVVQYRTRN